MPSLRIMSFNIRNSPELGKDVLSGTASVLPPTLNGKASKNNQVSLLIGMNNMRYLILLLLLFFMY